MNQREIWLANLNPEKGSEQAGFRLVAIVSGNLMNTYLTEVLSCPLTIKIKNYKGNVILKPDKTNGLRSTSEILVFHIRSISKDRLVEKIGEITPEELEKLKAGLDDILRY